MVKGPWDGSLGITTRWRYSDGDPHFAWDVACPMGTRLYALGDGVIVDCNDGVKDQRPGVPAGTGAPSNWIILRFIAPRDSKYAGQTLYAYYQHLEQHGVKVRPGQRVKQGDFIALSGNSGNTTGPHLHLVILKPGYTMNVYTRYNYLNNPAWVVWEPILAWKATKYGVTYEVYVDKLRPGVINSASVKVLRMALIKRKWLVPKAGLSVDKPGNDFTASTGIAVAKWQQKRGYKPTGNLTYEQAKVFFQNNEHVRVHKAA
jgi:hypothetical protein